MSSRGRKTEAEIAAREEMAQRYGHPLTEKEWLQQLRAHATQCGMHVLKEFIGVESASVAGRTHFGQMLSFLRTGGARCKTVLVEKTDRLYRNLKDYATVDELGLEVHFVKENQIIGSGSRASENFVHGIKVLMARNYSQNLGEETLKGMLQKARSGLYPSFAPAGYRNVKGPAGRRIIVPDGDAATVTLLFDEFATGQYPLKALSARARGLGWTIRGPRPAVSTLHQIPRKRIYTGDFD
jgi:DNA invertase Pin-like site-specific DNA recombinase